MRRAAHAAAGTAGRYWTTLVAGGVALFVPGPWLASYVGRFDFTSSVLIVTAVVNIHHFVLDGVVWKLRDPRVSKVLTSTQEHAAANVPDVRERGPRVRTFVRAAAVILLDRAGRSGSVALCARARRHRAWRARTGERVESVRFGGPPAPRERGAVVRRRDGGGARTAAGRRGRFAQPGAVSRAGALPHRVGTMAGRLRALPASAGAVASRSRYARQRRRARTAAERFGSRRAMVAARARRRRLAASGAPVSRRTARRRRADRRVAPALSALSRTGGARRETTRHPRRARPRNARRPSSSNSATRWPARISRSSRRRNTTSPSASRVRPVSPTSNRWRASAARPRRGR